MQVEELIADLTERLRRAESTRTNAQAEATRQTLIARDLAASQAKAEHEFQSIIDALNRGDTALALHIARRNARVSGSD